MTHASRTARARARLAAWLLGWACVCALSACGGGGDGVGAADGTTTLGAASPNDAETVQAALAAAAPDVAPVVNRAESPDIRLLAAQGQSVDLMLDTESTP